MQKLALMTAIFTALVALFTITISVGAQGPATPALDPNSEDYIAVVQACRDYVEGYFEGSAARIESGVHPKLIKRNPNGSTFADMNRASLIGYATSKKRVKPSIDVTVFDITKDIALAMVSSDFVDYCQLAKLAGKWQVLNVLWTYK